MNARTALCTECLLLPRRMVPHDFLRVIDVPLAERLWLFACEICSARWRLEAIGDGEEWVLAGRGQ
jgi:hypothetical protein